MQVLVTGGAGFIGSHLCKRLLEEGHEIVAIDNLSNGTEQNIEALIRNPRFEFIKMDVNDIENLRSLFETRPFEMVFHLAANADVYKGIDDSKLDLENTFHTTLNVLEMMRSFDVKKLFFASSSTVYGNAEEPIQEDSPSLRPISHYGAAKLASEAFVSSYSNLYNIQTWVARFCNVVGPNMTHGVIPDFIRKQKSNPKELSVYGDGTQTKPYIYIDDLLDGVMCMLKKSKAQYNAYLVGIDSTVTVAQIAYIVEDELGIHIPIVSMKEYSGVKCDVSTYQYDVSRLYELGWKPRYTAEKAVNKVVRLIAND